MGRDCDWSGESGWCLVKWIFPYRDSSPEMKKAVFTILLMTGFLYLYSANFKDMSKLQNLTGKVFGKLTVIEQSSVKIQPHGRTWLCSCRCGGEIIVRTGDLMSGHTSGCSLCKYETVTKHGLSRSKEYITWIHIQNRCKATVRESKYYHSRGIKVCDRWKNSFELFLSDMGYAPSKNHSIDRIDVNGNYEPSNCRWATSQEQQNNKTTTIRLSLNGQTKTFKEWLVITGLPRSTMYNRLLRGWSIEDILTKPTKTKIKIS